MGRGEPVNGLVHLIRILSRRLEGEIPLAGLFPESYALALVSIGQLAPDPLHFGLGARAFIYELLLQLVAQVFVRAQRSPPPALPVRE